MIRTRTRTTFLRRRRPRRGTPRLLADLAVMARLEARPARPSSERRRPALRPALAAELERMFALEGCLTASRRRRDETRRAA